MIFLWRRDIVLSCCEDPLPLLPFHSCSLVLRSQHTRLTEKDFHIYLILILILIILGSVSIFKSLPEFQKHLDNALRHTGWPLQMFLCRVRSWTQWSLCILSKTAYFETWAHPNTWVRHAIPYRDMQNMFSWFFHHQNGCLPCISCPPVTVSPHWPPSPTKLLTHSCLQDQRENLKGKR